MPDFSIRAEEEHKKEKQLRCCLRYREPTQECESCLLSGFKIPANVHPGKQQSMIQLQVLCHWQPKSQAEIQAPGLGLWQASVEQPSGWELSAFQINEMIREKGEQNYGNKWRKRWLCQKSLYHMATILFGVNNHLKQFLRKSKSSAKKLNWELYIYIKMIKNEFFLFINFKVSYINHLRKWNNTYPLKYSS